MKQLMVGAWNNGGGATRGNCGGASSHGSIVFKSSD
jgi:hypothetical protein